MDKDRKSDTKLQDSCLFHEIQHFNSKSILKKIDGYIHTDNQIQRYNTVVLMIRKRDRDRRVHPT